MEKIFKQFNKAKIRYCLLRGGWDIDISVHKEDWDKADIILRKNGFIKTVQNFNKNHVGYINGAIGFDIRHLDEWNGIYYLDEGIYEYRVLYDGIYYPYKIYLLAHYICHSILGKREWKYNQDIKQLITNTNLDLTKAQIAYAFGYSTASGLIDMLKEDKWPNPYTFVSEAILNHPSIFVKTFFSWIWWKIKPYPMIAIMGPDGSGKSTTADLLVKRLNGFIKYKVEKMYLGRGQSNVIPINKIGKKIKKRPKWMYYPYSFLSFLDLLGRYWLNVFPIRYKKIIVSDRSYMDILTMKHIPFALKKFYLLFFPKPKYLFHLYNDVKVLHKRRPKHPLKDLKRQMKIFDGIDSIKIKTKTEKQTMEDILGWLF